MSAPRWRVQRLGRRGDGVCVPADGSEGRALAPRVLPGELIAGTPDADGRIAMPEVIESAPHRVAPACPHYADCGGCALMHAADGWVARWKAGVVETALAAQRITARVAGVATSPPYARRRAALTGRRGPGGAVTLGFFARASDRVVDNPGCLVLDPAIRAARPALAHLVREAGPGDLRLTVTVTDAGLDVLAEGGPPAEGGRLSRLAAIVEAADWARLTWGDTPLTRRPAVLRIGPATVALPPGAFLQATPQGQAALTAAVRAAVGEAPRIADLFAGVGTFALPLAARAAVHAVEGLDAPLAALSSAARSPGLRPVTTERRDLAVRPLLPDELRPFDAIVIDPPRAGAVAQARALAASSVAVIAHVACDPVTFARDAQHLVAGGYTLAALRVVDQFRWSPHVEIVATFARR